MNEIPIILAVIWTIVKTSSYAIWEIRQKNILAGFAVFFLVICIAALFFVFWKSHFS